MEDARLVWAGCGCGEGRGVGWRRHASWWKMHGWCGEGVGVGRKGGGVEEVGVHTGWAGRTLNPMPPSRPSPAPVDLPDRTRRRWRRCWASTPRGAPRACPRTPHGSRPTSPSHSPRPLTGGGGQAAPATPPLRGTGPGDTPRCCVGGARAKWPALLGQQGFSTKGVYTSSHCQPLHDHEWITSSGCFCAQAFKTLKKN